MYTEGLVYMYCTFINKSSMIDKPQGLKCKIEWQVFFFQNICHHKVTQKG